MNERERAAERLRCAERDYQSAVKDGTRELRVLRRQELVRAMAWARVLVWLDAATAPARPAP